MRTTVTINDDLYQQALDLAGSDVSNASDLCREAMKTYVRVQAARRLAALGGKAPNIEDIPRHREASSAQ